jgi:hypothetical protein
LTYSTIGPVALSVPGLVSPYPMAPGVIAPSVTAARSGTTPGTMAPGVMRPSVGAASSVTVWTRLVGSMFGVHLAAAVEADIRFGVAVVGVPRAPRHRGAERVVAERPATELRGSPDGIAGRRERRRGLRTLQEEPGELVALTGVVGQFVGEAAVEGPGPASDAAAATRSAAGQAETVSFCHRTAPTLGLTSHSSPPAVVGAPIAVVRSLICDGSSYPAQSACNQSAQ